MIDKIQIFLHSICTVICYTNIFISLIDKKHVRDQNIHGSVIIIKCNSFEFILLCCWMSNSDSFLFFQKRSEKYSAIRSKQLPHTSGRRGVARLTDDMVS